MQDTVLQATETELNRIVTATSPFNPCEQIWLLLDRVGENFTVVPTERVHITI